jgi:hypothetical protein
MPAALKLAVETEGTNEGAGGAGDAKFDDAGSDVESGSEEDSDDAQELHAVEGAQVGEAASHRAP